MPADRYTSLAALKEHLGPHAWRSRIADRHSDITIISPHGGYIEAGTSALAHKIAGRSYNLFDFQGLRRENPLELHVTATNFRDKQLTALLDKSVAAVSIHGMGIQHKAEIWLGGLNKQLKGQILEALRKHNFAVNPDSPLYRGENPRNVVNLASNLGVQLEISDELMIELFANRRFTKNGRCPKTTARFDALVAAVRETIVPYRANLMAALNIATKQI